MLKRFTKSGKKQSKSGVILVTILFILAVAFILIGSALMMTANTRKRLYTFAEGGQARLTCTAAAQLFDTALMTQQVRDSEFKTLCDQGTRIWFTETNTPGMGGVGNVYDADGNIVSTGPAADNCTSAKFGWDGSKPTVAITTVIGTEVENILLTYEGTPETTVSSPFTYQVELGEGGRLDQVIIGNRYGEHSRFNADDNLVVSRGAAAAPFGSCDFYSTFITSKPMRSASGTHYYGDVVYAGDNAGVDMNGGGTGSGGDLQGGGTAFFIECDKIVWNYTNADATHEMFTGHGGAQVVFCNVNSTGGAIFQAFTGFSNGTIFEVSRSDTGALSSVSLGERDGSNGAFFSDGTGFAASAATGKDLSFYVGNLQQYIDPNYVDPVTNSSRPSSYTEFIGSTGLVPNTLSFTSDGHAPASASSLSSSSPNTGSVYKVTGDVDAMYEIQLTTAHDTIVYLDGNITINDGCGFRVSGGDGTNSSRRCFFIISRGGSVTLRGENSETGFFSSNCTNASTGGINQSQAPCIYIIGAGTGTNATALSADSGVGQIGCPTNQNNYVQAMVALYPFEDATNDAGDFYTLAGGSCHFYGRIIARTIRNSGGAHLEIPYCPQFSSGENPDGLYEAKSAYHLTSFDYYYTGTSGVL